MSGLFEQLNQAGLLAIGLNPEWADLDVTILSGLPSGSNDGVDLQKSPVCLVNVRVRDRIDVRTVRIEVTTFDLTVTVYTTIIDGNSVVFDAAVELPATDALLLQGIADKINADGTVGPIVAASVDPDNADTILIEGKAEADYTFDVTAVGGSGVVSGTGDPRQADARVLFTPGGTIKSNSTGAENKWSIALDAEYAAIDIKGLFERLDCAGLERAYIQVFNVLGVAGDGGSISNTTVAGVMVGPSVLEAAS